MLIFFNAVDVGVRAEEEKVFFDDENYSILNENNIITIIDRKNEDEKIKIIQNGEFDSTIELPNGDVHTFKLIGDTVYMDETIEVMTVQKYYEKVAISRGITGPWIYAYSYKCKSTYDAQGREIVSGIIGFIPYLGVVTGVISLIKSIVDTSDRATVYFKIDVYRDNSYRYLKNKVSIYKKSNYTGLVKTYWTHPRSVV